MRFAYEDIRKTLQESETDSRESSIEKALRSFGYDRFPEAGLDDTGKNKLIARILEIEKNEAILAPISVKESKKEPTKREASYSSLKSSKKDKSRKAPRTNDSETPRRVGKIFGSLVLAGCISFGAYSAVYSNRVNNNYLNEKNQLESFVDKATSQEDYLRAKEDYQKFISNSDVKRTLANHRTSDLLETGAVFTGFASFLTWLIIGYTRKKN